MRRLDRAGLQEALRARWERSREGRGGLVVVAGEAGSGKSTLVEDVVAAVAGARALWGGCDQLSTPRPLGPVHDLAPLLGDLTRTSSGEPRAPHEVCAAVFEHLVATPTVLVVEDVHWADQATIDLLRFLLRRIGSTRSLVVVTVRDDEIGPSHPLRALLGDAARSHDAITLPVPPLTIDEVAELVGDGPLDPAWLHRLTAGNAFFVVEMLDHEAGELPGTVRDAILARTADLDATAWDMLHLLACSPEAIPDHLLAPLGIDLPRLRSLHEVGLIRRSARGVSFRHDLCRSALADTIPPGADAELHRRMLEVLEGAPDAEPAVLVHHAIGARDATRILVHATRAARAAAASGAHTQAADLLSIALDRGALTDVGTQAELLELLAEESYIIDRLDRAIDASQRALRLRSDAGDAVGVSRNHRFLSVYHWYDADRDRSEHHADASVAVLGDPVEGDDEAVALGHALAMQAYLAIQANDLDDARTLLARADSAGGSADPLVRLRVAIMRGICDVLEAEGPKRAELLDLLAPAGEDLDEVYSSGFSNLTYLDVEQRRLADATDLLATSIPLTVERDLPICRVWQIGSRGRLKLIEGDWDEALDDADAVLSGPSAPLARTWPHVVRALVALRRGSADPSEDLDEAWALAQRLREPMRLLPVAAAIAERVWLTGTHDPRLEACRGLLAGPPRRGLGWARGELAARLRRLEPQLVVDVEGLAGPFALELSGRPEEAAQAWGALGATYEQALVLLDTGDASNVRAGLDLLDQLGADVTAAWFRQDLRRRGVANVPQRRRRSTRENAAGLTARQVDVLELLRDGCTNAEIAQQLFISAKTADHHVSAILAKLGVGSRREAVRAAREVQLID